MKSAVYCLILLLSLSPLSRSGRIVTYDEQPLTVVWDGMYRLTGEVGAYPNWEGNKALEITPMKALELVKGSYASNFEKIAISETEYYYKLKIADYYLVYEGRGETEEQYLFHLYEFVLDDPEEGIGHTVTYGWYQVNKFTGEIIEVQ